MLLDMIAILMEARTDKERETAFRNLEKAGVDRATARVFMSEVRAGNIRLPKSKTRKEN